MVEVNEGHRRFAVAVRATSTVIALSRVPELSTWTYRPDRRHGHAGCGRHLGRDRATSRCAACCRRWPRPPARSEVRRSATPARSAATWPRVRRRATGFRCSPHSIDRRTSIGADGRRTLPVADFMVGVKRTALAPGEMIESITVPLLDGWQGYSKVGVRNAMVIATASACLATDVSTRSVRIALGSVAPTIIRCPEAERYAIDHVDWDALAVAAESRHAVRRAGGGREPPDRRPSLDGRVPASRDRGDGSAACCERAFPGGGCVSEHYRLHVNGVDHDVADAWVGENLLYVLRERLGLMAAKGACEQGECGSCSVLVDGRLVCSCLVLAASAVGVADRHRRGARRARRTERRPAGVRRHRSRPVRLLHARA